MRLARTGTRALFAAQTGGDRGGGARGLMARPLDPGARLVLASHNPGKLVEIRELLAPWDIHVVSAGELGLPEPEETETSFAGNARLKAQAAAVASGLPSLSDDSGFCVGGAGRRAGHLFGALGGTGEGFPRRHGACECRG